MAEWHDARPPSANGAVSNELDVVVIGGGQAGLAIGYFLAQQGRKVRDPGTGRGVCGRLARAVGLAEAVHARSLQQLAGLSLPGQSG